MEAVPPSYEEATTRNYWRLIAPYIESSDLCSASRVCTAWYAIFEPFLWGNPASHFGTENDRVYGANIVVFTPILSKSRILIDTSCSDQVQADIEKSAVKRQKAYTYAASPACSIGDLRWTSSRMAKRYFGAIAKLTISFRLSTTVLRPSGPSDIAVS